MFEEKQRLRGFRKAIEVAIPMVGMLIVFGGVLFVPPSELQTQLMVVLVGVLMIEAGVWGMTTAVLPSERRYVALREEGDRFIGLIRRLNEARIRDRIERTEESAAAVRSALDEMHASVEIMGEVAGEEHAAPKGQNEAPTRT